VLRVEHKFVQFASNTLTAGVNVQNGYACNSIFRPSLTIDTAHQPYYYDQYVNLYAFYTVYKATIKIVFSNSTVADTVKCVLSWDDDASANTNMNTLAEMKYSRSCLLGPASGSTGSKVLSHTYTPAKWLGLTSATNAIRAGAGTDPADLFLWVVTMNGAAASSSGNIATEVSVTYWVEYSEPQTVAGS